MTTSVAPVAGTDANGDQTGHAYDTLDRLTITARPDGTSDHVYDEAGDLLTATDNDYARSQLHRDRHVGDREAYHPADDHPDDASEHRADVETTARPPCVSDRPTRQPKIIRTTQSASNARRGSGTSR